MRVLILAGNGMLGHKAFDVLSERHETFATFKDHNGLWRRFPTYAAVHPSRLLPGVDATDFESVVRAVDQVAPDVVINCVGIVKQRREAADPLISIPVNSLFPHRLAALCTAAAVRMIHVSTDCVFSGRKGNYSEDDLPDAVDLYGRTKLLGEVIQPGCLTIRTSIFGRDFLRQTGLLEWFLSNRGGTVRGYRNAIYSGFPTQVMARIVGDIIERHPHLDGLYHVASEPISKYHLLLKIRDVMKLDIEIEPDDDPPCDRSLSAERFVAATGDRFPAWDEMIPELVADLTTYDQWRKCFAGT